MAKMKTDKVSSINFAEDAGKGAELAKRDAYALTMINIVQRDSKVVEEGAVVGEIHESAGNRCFDGSSGIRIIPVAYKRTLTRYSTRDGKYTKVGTLTEEQVNDLVTDGQVREIDGKLYYAVDEDGRVDMKNSDTIKDARNHYVMLLDDDGFYSEALLQISGTATRASQRLMSAMSAVRIDGPYGRFQPPTYANIVRMTTTEDKNDHGSWHKPVFVLEETVSDAELYEACKRFHKVVMAGHASKLVSGLKPPKKLAKTAKVPKVKVKSKKK